ncbi:MAG: Hsp20/alpha crystallin family protein [Betaproteobacteria bacterium]|jgi:HSP20 family protein
MNGLPARRDAFSAFDEFFNDFFARAGVPVSPLAARASELPAAVRARMDVIDKGQKYEVLVDLPGVSKDDISVTVEGARVAIAAETKRQRTSEQDGKDGGRVLHTERYATSYARSLELPAEVTEDGAEAAFENGVLKLALPKRATVTSKRLTVR